VRRNVESFRAVAGALASPRVRTQIERVVLRLVVLSPFYGLLALGGVALAEDAGIVDPWSATLSGWFSEPRPQPAATNASSAAVRSAELGAEPVVSALEAVPGDDELVVEPWNPDPLEVMPDPWASTVGSQVRPLPGGQPLPLLAGGPPRSHDAWAYPIREIVDPWQRGQGLVPRDPLIVDPWAP
jgi:hypothetical protein